MCPHALSCSTVRAVRAVCAPLLLPGLVLILCGRQCPLHTIHTLLKIFKIFKLHTVPVDVQRRKTLLQPFFRLVMGQFLP